MRHKAPMKIGALRGTKLSREVWMNEFVVSSEINIIKMMHNRYELFLYLIPQDTILILME
jgi:hypothetical protein